MKNRSQSSGNLVCRVGAAMFAIVLLLPNTIARAGEAGVALDTPQVVLRDVPFEVTVNAPDGLLEEGAACDRSCSAATPSGWPDTRAALCSSFERKQIARRE